MTIQQYLEGLFEEIRREFPDQGRQMSMADQGTVYMTSGAYAALHKDLPRQPYDPENGIEEPTA